MTTTQIESTPTAAAREVLTRLETAWNEGDGEAFGSVYAPDASFVTVRGEHLTGRAAIGAGHDGIFRTIYAGSVNRMQLVQAHEIAPGVVLAVSLSTLTCPSGPFAGQRQAMSTNVISRTDDDAGWSIASTANTLVTA